MRIRYKHLFKFLCTLIVLSWAKSGNSADRDAQFKKLAFSPQWLKALHYEKGLFHYKSRIDDQSFFFSKTGKNDPLAELKEFVRQVKANDFKRKYPIHCGFPFRFRIATEAGLIPRNPASCDELEAFKKDLGTDSMGIVFVSQYADNPSSIMGHLFLQFVNESRQVEDEQLTFLNTTVNYAAAIPPDVNSIDYITKGIFGGFTGQYTLYRFSQMVEKYNNVESRDIFIYDLKFTREEIEESLEHIFELANFSSQDYFFFDENCAFQILAIIEAIRPNKSLTSKLPIYTTPIDVLKISAAANLIKEPRYRPSLFQRLTDKMSAMNSDERKILSQLTQFKSSIGKIRSPLIAEALADYINFEIHENRGKVSSKLETAYVDALLQRSRLGIEEPSYQKTVKISPHLSHGDRRFSLGSGSKSGDRYLNLRMRPAIHDLLSRPEGFQRHSELTVFETEVRQYSEQEAMIHEIQLLSVAKLFGSSVHDRTIWSFDFGFNSRDIDCQACLAPYGNLEIGLGTSLIPDRLDVFLMPKLSYQPYFDTQPWGGGIGIRAGGILTLTDNFRLATSYSFLFHPQSKMLGKLVGEATYDLGKYYDVRMHFQRLALTDQETAMDSSIGMGYSF